MVFNTVEEGYASATAVRYILLHDKEAISQVVLAIGEAVLLVYELKTMENEVVRIMQPIEQKRVLPFYVLEG